MNPMIGIVRKSAAAAAAACVAFVLPAPAAAQVAYSIADFGPVTCAPAVIDNSQTVAGQCEQTAAIWNNRAATSLGRLPNGTYSTAVSFNSQGVAVGNGDVGDSRPHALLYRGDKVIDIEPSAANAYAHYINEDGVIVGNYLKGFSGCANYLAVIWTEDSRKPGRFNRVDLQPYPGGDAKARCASAMAANQSLQVAGWVQNSLFGQRGALWNNDAKHTLTLLEPLPGANSSFAWAINDLGQVVGDSGNRGVLWNNDAAHTPIELPPLPNGDNYATARAINRLGHVLGSSSTLLPGSGSGNRQVIWRDGGVFELQSLLDPVSGSGWTIVSASALNDLGQIVGYGKHDGEERLFLMTPIAP